MIGAGHRPVPAPPLRVLALSDLHLEEQPCDRIDPVGGADVCVLAGDVARTLETSVRWASRTLGRAMPIVMVAGNHELYRQRYSEAWARARRAAVGRNVHLLERDVAVIGGVRFLGCTLWTDYALEAGAAVGRERDTAIAWSMMKAGSLIADHASIQSDDGSAFEPRHALDLHRRSVDWIAQEFARTFDGPTVVVTHHAPHPGSVAPRFRDHPLSAAYASDLPRLIEAGAPALWLHGHVHDSFDYRVGPTRVVCNPKGLGSENQSFDPGLVFGVDRP